MRRANKVVLSSKLFCKVVVAMYWLVGGWYIGRGFVCCAQPIQTDADGVDQADGNNIERACLDYTELRLIVRSNSTYEI